MKAKPRKPKSKKKSARKRQAPGNHPGQENLVQPWGPGESGNPGGRPKGSRSWHTVLKERFAQGKITQEKVADAIIKKANRGNTKAAEMIWDRMDGKPKETHSVESTAKVIPLDEIANPQLKQELLEAELAKLRAENKK